MLFALAALAALAGCTPLNAPSHTVSGTVTLNNMLQSGNATITVTQGSNSYTATVSAVNSFTYSVPGVPSGTYSVSMSFPSLESCGLSGSSVLLDSVSQTSSPSYDGINSIFTLTAASITIGADAQLDVSMTGNGC